MNDSNPRQDNGGKIVLREKDADMLLADHAKQYNVPPGAYSWKYVEDSVRNGIAQLKDRYLIGLHPDAPRPAGGGGGAKSSRTPFTTKEDAQLAKWVLSHPTDRTGNKIFMEYEKMVCNLAMFR